MIRRILLVAVLALLGGGAWYLYGNVWRVEPVSTAIALQAPVSEAIYGTGTVEPERWAKVVPLQRRRLIELCSCEGQAVKAGQVLGMPTDTFYGLAADPFNLRAVKRIYDVKSRQRNKPLSLLIESVDQAEELTRPLPEIFYLLARKYWPGPLTIIVPAASRLPLKVTANSGNVALRVPAAKIPMAVMKAAGIPITATSANVSGASECTTADGVRQQLGQAIPIIVDGGTSPREVASTIIDLSDESGEWHLQREGAIKLQDIVEYLASQGCN